LNYTEEVGGLNIGGKASQILMLENSLPQLIVVVDDKAVQVNDLVMQEVRLQSHDICIAKDVVLVRRLLQLVRDSLNQFFIGTEDQVHYLLTLLCPFDVNKMAHCLQSLTDVIFLMRIDFRS
jgi:hypothetical protein